MCSGTRLRNRSHVPGEFRTVAGAGAGAAVCGGSAGVVVAVVVMDVVIVVSRVAVVVVTVDPSGTCEIGGSAFTCRRFRQKQYQ